MRDAVPGQTNNPAYAGGSTAAEARFDGRTPRKTSARFYICVGMLLVAAATMQSVAAYFEVTFRKQAVPLKLPLDMIDQRKLLPDYRPHRFQFPALGEELVANLGTDQYLQWNLTDQRRSREDPTSLTRLFITYHTGRPDPVPHYPKECLAASGMVLRDESEIKVTVPRPDGVEVVIPVSILEFELPGGGNAALGEPGGKQQRLVVGFFFYANGRYVTSREAVRLAVANLTDRYAYYSKIEVSFSDDDGRVLPDRDQAIEATRRLLHKLMPILWEDHYQDWEALERGDAPVVRRE